jgi:hypothetical protein
MAAHYVLVDFENIQPEPEAWAFLNDARIKIIIFVNAKQKLSVDRVKALQPFGDRVDYIEMSGSGKNALDFMIAFYLGRIWSESAEAKFYVLSQDTGFDPLLKHLTAERPGSVKRVDDVSKIQKHVAALTGSSEPAAPPGPAKPEDEAMEISNQAAVPTSSSPPAAPPGIVRQRVISICEALQNIEKPLSISALNDFIKGALNDSDLPEKHSDGLIQFMVRKELISIDDNGTLSYYSSNIADGAKGEFISKAPASAPPPQQTPPLPIKELAEKVCDDLKKRGNSKPRTLKTLASTIKAIFKGDLSGQQVEAVLNFMKVKKIIAVSNGTKVAYNLEK